jgi:hypothetical protein
MSEEQIAEVRGGLEYNGDYYGTASGAFASLRRIILEPAKRRAQLPGPMKTHRILAVASRTLSTAKATASITAVLVHSAEFTIELWSLKPGKHWAHLWVAHALWL